jgi:hypothetical protein
MLALLVYLGAAKIDVERQVISAASQGSEGSILHA